MGYQTRTSAFDGRSIAQLSRHAHNVVVWCVRYVVLHLVSFVCMFPAIPASANNSPRFTKALEKHAGGFFVSNMVIQR
jgi:hypothetical protein